MHGSGRWTGGEGAGKGRICMWLMGTKRKQHRNRDLITKAAVGDMGPVVSRGQVVG